MKNIRHFLLNGYVSIFGKKIFYKLNRRIYMLSLHGMGIFNSLNYKISGEDHFLRRTLKATTAPLILDVGANKGAYAKRVKEISPGATVFALEPHPKTFLSLKEAAAANNFNAFNLGLSNETGKLKLYDYLDQDGSTHASLHQDVIEKLHGKKAIEHIVDVITLDEFAAQNNIEKIDLLKIDTEGNELSLIHI